MKDLVGRYVDFAARRTGLLLSVLLGLTLVMAFFASQLRIQTDLRVLLPKDSPAVISLEESERRLGATDFFTIAFEDVSAERTAQFQKFLADTLANWSEATFVQYDQDATFFEDRALLYFPVDELRGLRDRLQAMVDKGTTKANPFLVDLEEDEDQAPANLDGWPNPQALYREGLPMDVVETLLERIDQSKNDKKEVATPDSTPPLPDSLKTRLMAFDPNKKVWVGVVMARLNQPSTEAAFAAMIKARGADVIRLAQDKLRMPINAKVVGAYRDPSAEIDQVNSDMWLSGVIAVVLILGLLAFYLRKLLHVIVVFVPLLVAMAWMMGTADLVFGRLTVLTSFVIALLSGLGIEYNIHVFSRWMEERRNGLTAQFAMQLALVRTGRSLLSAMIASVVCMLALQVGSFQGFKEFGVVISMGIFYAFLTSMLVLAPLLFAALKIGAWGNKKFAGKYSWIFPTEQLTNGAQLLPQWSMSKRFVRIAFFISMAITLFLAFSPKVEFENDFRNLRGKGTSAGMRYGQAIGKGQDAHPSVILGQSEEQMREIHAQLSERFGTPQDTMLKSFVTVASFVPGEDEQEERLDMIAQVRKVVDGPAMEKADSATQVKIAELRRYLNPEAFTFADLPDYAKRFLTEANGQAKHFGYIYSKFRESDASESLKFKERFESFQTSTGKVEVASSGFIYADVVRLVKADASKLALFVFAFLAVVVLLDTRSWRGVLVNMGYVGLISLWTYWAMGWVGWKLGMFNIVVIPALLSNTVDATIHLYHRRMELGAGKLGEIYATAGSSVLAGTLTNAFGFTALAFVSHQGLQTIGLLATLGYVSGLTIMFLTMPWLLETICPKEPQH